jgi:hypothetical protein
MGDIWDREAGVQIVAMFIPLISHACRFMSYIGIKNMFYDLNAILYHVLSIINSSDSHLHRYMCAPLIGRALDTLGTGHVATTFALNVFDYNT